MPVPVPLTKSDGGVHLIPEVDVPAGEGLAAVPEVRDAAFQGGTGAESGRKVGLGGESANFGVFAHLIARDILANGATPELGGAGEVPYTRKG